MLVSYLDTKHILSQKGFDIVFDELTIFSQPGEHRP
jgi:hypothetical protein